MPLKQIDLFSFDEPLVQTNKATELLPEIKKEVDIEFVPWDDKTVVEKSKRGRKKIAVDGTVEVIEIPDDEILFQKKYYSIGIVANMFKANISLIRFWEKEFDILKPKLNGKGDRHFRPEDIKNLQLIHHLLKEKKYSIEGAKEFLKNNKNGQDVFKMIEDLKKMKLFLLDLKMSI